MQAIKIIFKRSAIILMNVYILPDTKGQAREQVWNILAEGVEFLEMKCPSAEVLICGDLNARVGTSDSIFYKALDVEIGTSLPPCCVLSRSSKDKLSNTAGLALTKLCIRLNMIWLNGLSQG